MLSSEKLWETEPNWFLLLRSGGGWVKSGGGTENGAGLVWWDWGWEVGLDGGCDDCLDWGWDEALDWGWEGALDWGWDGGLVWRWNCGLTCSRTGSGAARVELAVPFKIMVCPLMISRFRKQGFVGSITGLNSKLATKITSANVMFTIFSTSASGWPACLR